jgi:opacity protein-like surface antigen
MRKELLLSCSILAVSAAGAQAGEIYVSVFGGMNITGDEHRSFLTSGPIDSGTVVVTTEVNTNLSNGFVVGGAVGTELDRWLDGLRAEVEVSYRRNKLKGDWQFSFGGDIPTSVYTTTDFDASGTSDGHLSRFAVMANVWYDIDAGSKIVPYVGGGVGWNRAHLEVGGEVVDPGFFLTDIEQADFSESGFAWQLGAGANYEVSPGVKVGVGYRYFHGADVDRAFGGKNSAAAVTDEGNHTVQANVTVDLN